MNVLPDRAALLRMAKRRAGILLVSLCAGVGGGHAVTVLTPSTYAATASVVITGGTGHEPTAHVTVGDLATGQGASSPDNRSKGSTLKDFVRAADLVPITSLDQYKNYSQAKESNDVRA